MSAKFRARVLVLHRDKTLNFVDLDRFPRSDLIRTETGARGPLHYYAALPNLKALVFDTKTFQLRLSEVKELVEYPSREVDVAYLRGERRRYVERGEISVYGVDDGSLRLSMQPPSRGLMVLTVDRMLISENFPIEKSVLPKRAPPGLEEIELPLDHRLGYLIGAMVGGGTVIGHIIRFSCASAEVRDQFLECLLWQFGPESVVRESELTARCLVAKGLIATSLGSWTGDSDNKWLPPFFLFGPESFRMAMFAGLMDTCGSIYISKAKRTEQLFCRFSSTSQLLIQQVKWLAASLGIRSEILSVRNLYQLVFDSADMCRWRGEGLFDSGSLEKLNTVREHRGSPNDYIPISPGLAQHIYQLTDRKDAIQNSIRVSFVNAKKTNIVSRQRADDAISLFENRICDHPEGELWMGLSKNLELGWSLIQSVSRVGPRERGYDLVLEDNDCRLVTADGLIA